MSRKDYKRAAEHIAYVLNDPRADVLTVALVAHELCSFFKQDNPRFDRYRFLAACGLPEEHQP